MIWRSLILKGKCFFSKTKISQEMFIETNTKPKPTMDHLEIKKIDKKENMRQMQENPIPCSPKIGPITIKDPVVGTKLYRWCSCGLSQNQPFCDQSHNGTAFKPIKFTIEEVKKDMDLCGCKLSKEAPFCDKFTCKEILK